MARSKRTTSGRGRKGLLGHWFESLAQARMRRVQHELALSELALDRPSPGRKKGRTKKRKARAR